MAIDYETGRLYEITGWSEEKIMEALNILVDLQELYQRIAELEDENKILKEKEAAINEAKKALNNKCIDKEKD